MEKEIYEEAIDKMNWAFAYHKAIFDKNGEMIDYIFLDVDDTFEELTGLKRENVVNRSFVKEISKDDKSAKKWLKIYEGVLVNKEEIEIKEYSEDFDKNFLIKAYSPKEDHFVTLFLDRTFEIKIQELSRYFIDNVGKNVDYDKITEFAHDISGAKHTMFNLFSENGKSFTTVSLIGNNKDLGYISEYMGEDLVGKVWTSLADEKGEELARSIYRYNNLYSLVKNNMPRELVENLEDVFNIGDVVVAKTQKDEKALGDFVLLFEKGQELKNKDFLSFYLSQLGLFIEKTRLQSSLKKSQNRFYTLAEYAPIGFMSCDIDGNITYANKRILKLIGSPSYDKTKKFNLLAMRGLKDQGFSEKLLDCINNDKEITYEMGYESIWGRFNWLRVHYTPSKEDGEIVGASIVVDDITDKKFLEDELKDKAERDALTGAYNRHILDTKLIKLLEESKEKDLKSCVLVLDIDDFKAINDNYGHKTGDEILKYASRRVKKELRDKDLLIRTGGDEFLIYLHDIEDEENARHFVKRIFHKITGKYRLGDDKDENSTQKQELDVSCSIGSSIFPRNGETIEDLISKADENLYRVKHKGKSSYRID